MRILQIRFKNLNSLVGEWKIDLTHLAFSSDGIFAITGPTGAGKTTILDAVCLALYGRTPRLNKITKSGNEIMSRQTGECYAEATFETRSGRYRCHWSQHRARKRPDGELQPPKHEIADADSGRIFETKLRGVAEQIEAATGMDFDRFTRSMLLAQGGFAAFLQAAPDERAPILEQITGTEIYSRISIRVHERRSEERKRLDALSAELAAMQLLSGEDEGQLNASLENKLRQEAELNRQVEEKTKAVAWLDGIAKLEQELKLVAEQKRDLQMRQEAFAPEGEKLARAVRALDLAGEHAGLSSIRLEQETDRRSRKECAKALPGREEAVKRAEGAVKAAGEHLEKKKAEQKEASLIIRKARELDLKLREKEAPIKSAGAEIVEREKTLDNLRFKQGKDLAALGNKKNAFEALLKHLDETKGDEALVENLAGIRSRFDALEDLCAQQGAKAEEVKAAERERTDAVRIWRNQTAKLEAGKRGLDAVKEAFAQKRLHLEKTLENRDLTAWREDLSALKERKLLLGKAGEAVRSIAESRRSFEELSKRCAGLAAQKTDLAKTLQIEVEKHAALEREQNLLERELSLLKKIQDYEEARRQLQDGEPCPLCGAREHPFAEGNEPVPDETAAALVKVRAELKAAGNAVSELRVREATASKDLELAAERKKECAEKMAASEALVKQSCAELAIEGSDQELEEVLLREQKETEEALGRATKLVQAAEMTEKEITALRESLEKARESVVSAEREVQNAAHKKHSVQQALERAGKDVETLDEKRRKALSALQQEVSAYRVGVMTMDSLMRIQLELTARRDQWVARQQEKSSLEKDVSVLEMQTRSQNEQIRSLESELKKQRALLSALQSERDAFIRERREVFGDKNPDEEETLFTKALEEAEKGLDASRRSLNDAAQALSTLKNRIDELDKSTAARAVRLRTAEEGFLARLGALGFADEAAYVAACLPEEERKKLLQQAQGLEKEQTELHAREREKTTHLKAERQKQVTDRSREELTQALAALAANQKDLQQEIGGIRRKLKDNEDLRRRQQERVLALEAQKRECARWDLLHELIGSADGKKYRNFAQGLTFEMMIGHANRQLQKMTDRYLLIRDEAQPLELNVIDNYQAGEIRSTKNLSGGESFIVSLSLALGLSHMAGKNVRVDSLFLDEGFGSLDEEALDTALETLAGLRREGKLIGVISHVPALKERISAQIRVAPQTGGRSVISGPGCGPFSGG